MSLTSPVKSPTSRTKSPRRQKQALELTDISKRHDEDVNMPVTIMPVARMLVKVVPRVAASTPPARGVHVLFRLKAASSKLNSVFEVPISLVIRDLRGARIYVALQSPGVQELAKTIDLPMVKDVLVASDAQRACT